MHAHKHVRADAHPLSHARRCMHARTHARAHQCTPHAPAPERAPERAPAPAHTHTPTHASAAPREVLGDCISPAADALAAWIERYMIKGGRQGKQGSDDFNLDL